MTFQKVWFSSPGDVTIGFVYPSDVLKNKTVTDLSRLHPVSQANKMRKLHVSPEYATWDGAFKHDTKGGQ